MAANRVVGTRFVSSLSGGTYCRMPTLAPGEANASPFSGWSSPAMIVRTSTINVYSRVRVPSS